MRRWNGWGDESVEFALSADALAFLAQRIGSGRPVADAALADCLQQDLVLRAEEFDLLLLVLIDGAGKDQRQQLPRLQDELHREIRLARWLEFGKVATESRQDGVGRRTLSRFGSYSRLTWKLSGVRHIGGWPV